MHEKQGNELPGDYEKKKSRSQTAEKAPDCYIIDRGTGESRDRRKERGDNMMAYYYPAEEIAENIKSGLDELAAVEITGAAIYAPEITPVAFRLLDLIQGRRSREAEGLVYDIEDDLRDARRGVEVMVDAYEDSREKLQGLPEYRRAIDEKDAEALADMASVYRAAVFDNCRRVLRKQERERRR